MRVKIGDTIFDAENEPIMLIFDTDDERKTVGRQISEMPDEPGKVRKYVQYPECAEIGYVTRFMQLPIKQSIIEKTE